MNKNHLKLMILPAIVLSTALFVGCDKLPIGTKVKCNDEDTKKLTIDIIDDSINDSTAQRVKELIEYQNITLDMGKVRSLVKQLNIAISDVRTSNSDPNSNKEFCEAELSIKIPTDVVEQANASRELYGETNVAQQAILQDLSFDLNQVKHQFEYVAQPTDDGEKIYVTIENQRLVTDFVANIVIDSMLKNARQEAMSQAQMEEQQRQADIDATEAEYAQLQLSEAQFGIDNANKNLNLVWNAASKSTRNQLLDNQRMWLKKRELECKLKGNDAEYGTEEIVRLNCETEMTKSRTQDLRQAIYQLDSEYSDAASDAAQAVDEAEAAAEAAAH